MSADDEMAELVRWAEAEANRIGHLQDQQQAPGSAVYGLAQASSALEFLRRNAPGSRFANSAERLFIGENNLLSATAALQGIVDILMAWARSTSESWAQALPFEVQARIEAANDLMEQVQQLLDDAKVHEAAPIVLAGAALEEFLRSQIVAKGLTPSGKPGISAYAAELQKDGYLSKQDVKQITAWAGLRNYAAHGEWDQITREEARIMVMGVNLFLQQRTATP